MASYSTAARVVKEGRAVAIDLSDAALPAAVPNPHMTLFFDRVFSDAEVAAVQACVDNFKSSVLGRDRVPFALQPWGPRSEFVLGDLKSLCEHVRAEKRHMFAKEQRAPHVALR